MNWANWALGLKNLSFKMRPSMSQKSHDACTTFRYNYLFSLLSSSPNLTFIVKKNGIHLSFSTLMLLYLITDRSHYYLMPWKKKLSTQITGLIWPLLTLLYNSIPGFYSQLGQGKKQPNLRKNIKWKQLRRKKEDLNVDLT